MEIRWKYRFESYKKAYHVLLRLHQIQNPNEGERMGLIQAFEMSFELAWKLLSDYLTEIGYSVKGPRPVIKQAFQDELLNNGEIWLDMLLSRNQSTHVYNETIASEMIESINSQYLPCFTALLTQFQARIDRE